MLKLTCFFVTGAVLVSAYIPTSKDTFYIQEYKEPFNGMDFQEGLSGCREDGCRAVTEAECKTLGNKAQWNTKGAFCKLVTEKAYADKHLCHCNVQFMQPTNPLKPKSERHHVA